MVRLTSHWLQGAHSWVNSLAMTLMHTFNYLPSANHPSSHRFLFVVNVLLTGIPHFFRHNISLGQKAIDHDNSSKMTAAHLSILTVRTWVPILRSHHLVLIAFPIPTDNPVGLMFLVHKLSTSNRLLETFSLLVHPKLITKKPDSSSRKSISGKNRIMFACLWKYVVIRSYLSLSHA